VSIGVSRGQLPSLQAAAPSTDGRNNPPKTLRGWQLSRRGARPKTAPFGWNSTSFQDRPIRANRICHLLGFHVHPPPSSLPLTYPHLLPSSPPSFPPSELHSKPKMSKMPSLSPSLESLNHRCTRETTPLLVPQGSSGGPRGSGGGGGGGGGGGPSLDCR